MSEPSTAEREIIYLTDPMCSWCWGFSPVIAAIREKYGTRANIRIVMGGLRVGTKETFSDEMRDFVLHHWHEVKETTGQDFTFDFEMPEGFRYDTEPSCRAVVAVRRLAPDRVFDYFKALQRAFYVENLDITNTDVLAAQAAAIGVDEDQFRTLFESEVVRTETRDDIMFATNLGVRGFPSVVLRDDDEYRLLTIGYRDFDVLDSRLDEWIAE